jgi:hypothetical protein
VLGNETAVEAAHPGLNAGLTYPVKDAIRVDPVIGTPYDLALPGATDVSWTPDGRFLAFVSAGESPGIHIVDSAGCGLERLTSDPSDRAPNFDGVHLYFTRGTQSLQLDYDFEATTSPVTGEPEPAPYGTDVAVSIIEARYAHVRAPTAGDPGYVLVLDDVFLRDETVEVFRSSDPITGTEWAPDGSLLAFEATADDGSTQTFAAHVVGDPIVVEQVTDAGLNGVAPAFSPDGQSLAWMNTTANRQSGVTYVRDLDTGEDVFVTQQAHFALDWQPKLEGWYEPAVPIETETIVSLDGPSTGPGLHAFSVSVDPAPADGSVEVVIDGGEPATLAFDEAGVAHGVAELDIGIHQIQARFGGSCPHRASAGELTVEVQAPDPPFDDIGDSKFVAEIEWLAGVGITTGCGERLFCPDGLVTRKQMATFISRAFDLPDATRDFFTDDDGMAHEDDVNRLAEAGITTGCAPQRFCPHRTLTRKEVATILVRALELPPATRDWFDDDDGLSREDDINRLAEAGITTGCGPRQFCPARSVTREQMAAFLYRAFR